MTLNKLIIILLAGFFLLGYSAMYGYVLWLCGAESGPAASKFLVERGEAYTLIATTLSGLVGGIAAMRFNEKLPVIPKDQLVALDSTSASPISITSAQGGDATVAAIKDSTSISTSDSGIEIVSSVYAILYIVLGCASVVAYVTVKDVPEMVSNVATISFGLFLAIIRSVVIVRG